MARAIPLESLPQQQMHAVPCGQKRLFLKNLGRGLAGCIAFQHALCMCRECQSACLAPFLRACPIAESGLPQCVHKRVGFLGGGHCDCIAAVLHFCLVEHTHALHPQGYWTTRPVATLLSATPPCGSTSSRASSTLVAVALLWMPCRRRSKCRYMGLREAAQRARRVARHVCHIRTCKLRVDPQTSPGKGEGVAAGAQRVEIGVCNANLNPMHAVYNAPHLPDRPRADSSRLGGGAPRGRFGLRAWAARALRNLGGPGRPGAAIRRSDASMQFTKLRSGSTRPPLRALLKPTTPTATPMPAPTLRLYENTWSPAGRRQGPRDTNLPNLCTPGRTWLHGCR